MPLLLETGGTDVLADILDSLRLKGRIFCRCELSAPWAIGRWGARRGAACPQTQPATYQVARIFSNTESHSSVEHTPDT